MAIPAPDAPIIAYDELERKLRSAKSKPELFRAVANLPFEYKLETALLFLGLISFFIADKEAGEVKLAAVSDTEYYRAAVENYNFDPKNYRISLDDPANSIAKTIKTSKPQKTNDWANLRRPGVPSKYPRANQANSGIANNAVYPLDIPGGGALLYSYYQYGEDMGKPQEEFMSKYAALVSKALKRAPSLQ